MKLEFHGHLQAIRNFESGVQKLTATESERKKVDSAGLLKTVFNLTVGRKNPAHDVRTSDYCDGALISPSL